MNVFYLAAGLAALATSVLHAIWAEKRTARELENSNMTDLAKSAFRIAWHQVTALLAVSGAALIILAVIPAGEAVETSALLIAVILSGNIIVFIAVSMRKYPDTFRSTLYPVINSIAIIFLIILGFLI